MENNIDEKIIIKKIEEKLINNFGCTRDQASKAEIYRCVIMTINDILSKKYVEYNDFTDKHQGKKIYYICMEFLLGKSLKSAIFNLNLELVYKNAIKFFGFDIEEIYNFEPDAGLGNGGLGRLAACFMDSLSSLNYPAKGFTICYEYGLFKQKIENGTQYEINDDWLEKGNVWLLPKQDQKFIVKFGGMIKEYFVDGKMKVIYENAEEIVAIPFDMMIAGYKNSCVNQLRLWKAKSEKGFDMKLFSKGQYDNAVYVANNAEVINKVLYPPDNHLQGKILRLSQQYFLVSASMQSIISNHVKTYGNIDNLKDKVAIHINDTHPALCIPELMRILLDEYSYEWENAFDIVTSIISYTNHTIMPEALECWQEDIFKERLPRIYSIVKEINYRFCKALKDNYDFDDDKIATMSIISQGKIKMANLSVIGSHYVNGVSKLHSQILKKDTFSNFTEIYSYKFLNITNGVNHRRWLVSANPKLCKLFDRLIGPDYRTSPEQLCYLRQYMNDHEVLNQLQQIKKVNKKCFSDFIYKQSDIKIDPESVFDVQIKRFHEYKRQLLNVLKIISIYIDIRENPNMNIHPMTFFFGGKAASTYYMAKRIIKLICLLSKEIEKNKSINEKLKIVFLEDYNVTMAEKIIPSADISEQISLAGKEASGTGCMKFMMNGALTIGTLDGANIEILENVGEENIFIFGLEAKEVGDIFLTGYNPALFYNGNEKLIKVISFLSKGFGNESFSDISEYLLHGNGGIADPYMCIADFDSYYLTHKRMIDIYQNNPLEWYKKALMNISGAGYFSSDRSIEEYANKIWDIKKVIMDNRQKVDLKN